MSGYDGYWSRDNQGNNVWVRTPREQIKQWDNGISREFDTGATRDTEDGKYDYEAFLSPEVLAEFAAYMHSKRQMPDGTVRDGDNWQNGFPRDVLVKSLMRHVMDIWLLHRTGKSVRPETGEETTWDDALGGAMFNIQALWFEHLRDEGSQS